MKRIAIGIAVTGITVLTALAGCQQTGPTLEQAQAACTQKGGLLAIIYTQKITSSGVGAPTGSPGGCILPSRFAPKAAVAPPAATKQP